MQAAFTIANARTLSYNTNTNMMCVCVYRPRYPVLLSIIRAPNAYLFPNCLPIPLHAAAAARCTCALATLQMQIVHAQPFNREFLFHVRFALFMNYCLWQFPCARGLLVAYICIYIYMYCECMCLCCGGL